jgi:predicted DNA binding CopG/RHH family protein
MKKKVPKLNSDKAAERFLEQDLSDLDFSQFRPARFEFETKTARVNMRLPKKLLATVKKRGSARKMLYRRFIREALVHAVTTQK